MKSKIVLAASLFAGLAQVAAAHTEIGSYPLRPVLDAQQAGAPVALYFGDAPHPAVAASKGAASDSVRIARGTNDKTAACNAALQDGINQLRAYARNHGANGVINIATRFHLTKTHSASTFTCATSESAAAMALEGTLVNFEAK